MPSGRRLLAEVFPACLLRDAEDVCCGCFVDSDINSRAS
jgi:hypothetical protein